jgi:hypothetical protein
VHIRIITRGKRDTRNKNKVRQWRNVVEGSLIVLLTKVVYEVNHLGLRHGAVDGFVGLVENPEWEPDPKRVEEDEVNPARDRAARLALSVYGRGMESDGVN